MMIDIVPLRVFCYILRKHVVARTDKQTHILFHITSHLSAAVAKGFLSTKMTESPRRNILLMYRSLLTGFAFFVPFPVFGNSVHISFTFSKTILQCRSNAFTRPSSFLLFRQLIRTCVLFRTDSVRIERGPVLNSSSSSRESSSGVISDFGLAVAMICMRLLVPIQNLTISKMIEILRLYVV